MKIFEELMKDFQTFRLVPVVGKILQVQEYNGSWSKQVHSAVVFYLGDNYVTIGDSIIQKIKECVVDKPQEDMENIFYTLLMLYILENFYGPYEEEWQQNQKKAKTFLEQYVKLDLWWLENEVAQKFDH